MICTPIGKPAEKPDGIARLHRLSGHRQRKMLLRGLFRSLYRYAAIKHYRDLHRDTVGCYDQRGIQVHVALRDAARGMSK
jgi:hypothetical protein